MSLRLVNVLASLFAFLGLLAYGDYSFTQMVVLADLLIIVSLVTHYALGKIASDARSGHAAMAVGVILFFWIAYTLKLPVAALFPRIFWVVPELVGAEQLRTRLPFAFFIAVLGYSLLLLTIVTAPSRRTIDWRIGSSRPNIPALLFLSFFALAAKYVLKDLYSLGVPTVDPVDFGIPMLTGFTTMVIEIGFFILVNMLLFAGIYTARGWILLAGMTAAFGNAGIELVFGSKEFLMYQLAVTFAYIFIARKFGPADRIVRIRRQTLVATVTTGVIGVFTLLLYKFFNLFRYARLSDDLDVASAISALSSSRAAETGSSFFELWSRLNGVELLSAVLAYHKFFGSFDIVGIFSGAISEKFVYLIMGTSEVHTRFGLTVFGFFYIAGGVIGVVIGVVLLALFFLFLQNFILRARVDNHARIAALPALWILMVKVLFGGGNLVLVAKEFFIFLLVFWVLGKFLFPRVQEAGRHPGGLPQPRAA